MINRVVLVGRLVRDPEVRGSSSSKVVSFTIAVNRSFKNSDGEIEADFIRCVAFGKLAELLEKYLRKGLLVGVEGRIRTGSYQATDGRTVYFTDINCDSVDFLSPKSSSNNDNTYDNGYRANSSLGQEVDNPFAKEDSSFEDDYSSFKIASDDLPF